MKLAVPLLYWLGLLIVLAGLFLRFWMGQPEMARWGLAMALVGMALVLAARVAQAMIHRRGRHQKEPPATT